MQIEVSPKHASANRVNHDFSFDVLDTVRKHDFKKWEDAVKIFIVQGIKQDELRKKADNGYFMSWNEITNKSIIVSKEISCTPTYIVVAAIIYII